MIFKIPDILREVRVSLDENGVSDELLRTGDVETLSLDDIIRQKVPEAVRLVHTAAPTYLLESGNNFGDAVYWGDLESGWVLLPDDFMRLLMFRMSDWERTVYTAISTEDEEYERQRSRFKGIRGTSQKPVCAIALRPEGKVLEFYSCKSEEAEVAVASYLPYPKVDRFDGIDISERCYRAVVYMAAALTLQTYGEAEKASAMTELSKSFLQ